MRYTSYSEATDRPHVVVDGSAQAGTVLVLSHWPGAPTPEALRADLSAEIAFRYLAAPDLHVSAELATNNHFDQDGLVGLFALTDPAAALGRREHLIDVARAGDFSHFHERDAARAAFTIAALAEAAEADPYPELLERLPEIVDHTDRFRSHWADEDGHLAATEAAIARGTITITEEPELDLAVVRVPNSWARHPVHRFITTTEAVAHPYAIHNATERTAVLTLAGDAPELRYRYETWVHLVSRRPRARVDLTPLAAELTAADTVEWSYDAIDGLSPALRASGPSTVDPEEFVTRVRAELTAARATWSPFPI